MEIKKALNYRPVRVVGWLTAAHSFIVGFGYTTKLGENASGILYQGLGSDEVRLIFGLLLLVTGTLLMFAFTRNNPKTIRAVSLVQSFIWLYATFLYAINGAVLLAIALFLLPTLVSSYISYAHGNRRNIISYDRTPQAEQDTDNEDRL